MVSGQGFELGTLLKQIQIAVSCPTYRLLDSRIQEMFACGIRNIAQRIQNPTNEWNPESKFHWQRIWNPCAWNAESAVRNLESLTGGKVRPILTSKTPIYKFSNLTAHSMGIHF